MKNVLSLVLDSVPFAVSILAGYYAITPSPQKNSGLQAEVGVVQLGERREGEVLRGAVRFHNTSPATVHVLEWTSSCSCTGVAVTEREIQPGGYTDLSYEWRIGSQQGPRRETLSILYRYGPEQIDFTSVQLHSVVGEGVICEPGRIEFVEGQASSVAVKVAAGRLKYISFEDPQL